MTTDPTKSLAPQGLPPAEDEQLSRRLLGERILYLPWRFPVGVFTGSILCATQTSSGA
jgi:hypothetical protein